MDDNYLIEQAKAGNPQAFRLLVLRYQGPMFKFLSGFGMPSARVEEIAQETFLKVYQNMASYQKEKGASFMTWMFVIAKRLAINEMARPEYRQQIIDMEHALDIESYAYTPLESLESEERQRLVTTALQKVSEPFRSALSLSYIEDLKIAEIAEIEQCSVGTVKSRIFRGKQILLGLLTQATRTEQ